MSNLNDARQIPLFPAQPQSTDDLWRGTLLKHTVDLFAQHLTHEGKSEHTVKAFTGDLHLLGEFEDNATRAIGDFTTQHLDAFMHWLEFGRGVPCSRKSYARRVTTLKVFFKWLHSLGAIAVDPAAALLQRSGQAPLSEALTLDQIREVIYASRTMRYRKTDEQDYRPELLLRLILDTGIKKSETMALTPAHVKRDNPQQPYLEVRYKSRNVFKERKIDLDSDWVKLLDLYLQQYQPRDVIFNCTARNLEYVLSDIGERAGLEFKLSFEILRWTCAVRDFRAGMDENDIRQKLGLSEISWHETGHKIKKLSDQMNRT